MHLKVINRPQGKIYIFSVTQKFEKMCASSIFESYFNSSREKITTLVHVSIHQSVYVYVGLYISRTPPLVFVIFSINFGHHKGEKITVLHFLDKIAFLGF